MEECNTKSLVNDNASATYTQDALVSSPDKCHILDMPLEIQIMIIRDLYTNPWVIMIKRPSIRYPALVISKGCEEGPLRIPALRDIVSEVFHENILAPKNMRGMLMLPDNTYNNLPANHYVHKIVKAVSSGVTELNLGKQWTTRMGMDDLKERFPKLRKVYVEGSKVVSKYWKDNGPVFARGNFCLYEIIMGRFDGMFSSFMSDALDTLIPPRRCENSLDIEIEAILVIKGNLLNTGDWSSRFGVDDNLAIQFISKGDEVQIVKKWFYITGDGRQARISNTFWGPVAHAQLANKEVDLNLRPAPPSQSQVVLID